MATQELAKLADPALANELVQILPKLLENETETIDKATEEFRKLSEKDAFLPTLTQIMISQETDIATRQLSAVLFRRRILKKWQKFDSNMKKLVRQASLEYLSNADSSLYKSLAEIVAGIAEHELGEEGGWPELLQVLQQSTNNSNAYADRLKGTELLKCVCNQASDPLQLLMGDMINLFASLLQATDVNAGNAETGQSVHRNIVDSIQPVIHFMEEEHMKNARVILPRLIQVVDEIVAWDETTGSETLGIFTELCEIECSNYVTIEHAKAMAEVCIKTAVNANYEEDTRSSALNQLQMIIKYKRKAFIKYDLIEPLCLEMQKMIVGEEDPDDGIMSGEGGDRSVYTSALQVIDQLAMYVPAEKTMSCCSGPISQLLADSKPNSQRAGLLILSAIVEGCADLILTTDNCMDELVPAVCNHLRNNEASVRSAAYFALGQFSEHLQPDIADYADTVMPQLMAVISAGPTSPEFQNRDVITKIYYALETFVESLGGKPNGIDQYIDQLMSTLVGSLADSQGSGLSVHLLECIVGSIGAVATAADDKFNKFLDQTVEILQNFFPSEEKLIKYEEQLAKAEDEGLKIDEEDDKFQLWSRAIVTLSCICRAVGADSFLKYAGTTMEMAVTLSNHSDDPDIKSSAFSLFSALSSVLKEQMQPHMATIVDILFQALDEDVLDFTGGDGGEERVKRVANILELSKDGELTEEDGEEDNLSLDALDNLNVETGPIEAKVTALETLCEIAESCPVAFGPFMQEAYTKALEIASLEGSLHDEILRSSITSCLIFSSQLYKFGEETDNQEMLQKSCDLCTEVWPMALHSVRETPERTVCMSILYHLEKSIQIVGKTIFQDGTVLKEVMEVVHTVLSDKASCQDVDGEEPSNDEDQAEHDQLLIEYACDILPTTCNAIGYQKFRDVWAGFYPVLRELKNCRKIFQIKNCFLNFLITFFDPFL